MRPRNITPENTEFVILSFEGPDRYSLAGGLGVRVSHLSETLAGMGFPTHLIFVGDPHRQGEEHRHEGMLTLHRWCQWISQYYPNGVYQGENDKLYDFNESVPYYIKDQIVRPAVDQSKLVVILGEEWHTTEAICRTSDLLYYDGLRNNAVMFWNANNTMSFHHINWGRLAFTTTLTTVSRYMKHIMWSMGLNPLVIPNGIPDTLLRTVDEKAVRKVRKSIGPKLTLLKVARWDIDKRWDMAMDAIAQLKAAGNEPVFIARGGVESHGQHVIGRARSLGLTVKQASTHHGGSFDKVCEAVEEVGPADVIDIRSHLSQDTLRILYRASDCVLANSGHEPFGLVGLEAMAAGGVVFTGCTGEDYAVPFHNAFVLETDDPQEIVTYVNYLREHPEEETRIRRAARKTAKNFTWQAAATNLISKLENQARLQGLLAGRPKDSPSDYAA